MPMDTWKLTYSEYDPEQEMLREALCTLGNGYFATRGAGEETSAGEFTYPGTYLAGGYNRAVTEMAGRDIVNEDLVNFPNWLALHFRIEGGDWFDLNQVKILSYRQELDLKEGVLVRCVRFKDSGGRTSTVKTRRLVSMADPHLAGLELRLSAEDWSGKVDLRTAIDGRVINSGVARYRQLASKHLVPEGTFKVEEDTLLLVTETTQSEIRMAQAARTRVYRGDERVSVTPKMVSEPDYIYQEFAFDIQAGTPVTVEKIVSLYTSRDSALADSARSAEYAAQRAGRFQDLFQAHTLAWKHLWNRCDIELEPARDEQMVLRLHIFHLLQTVSPNSIDLDIGVPARGWHGEAYRGHIFWDEIYIFPFLNQRIPEITRALLHYRYRRLPEARFNAAEEGYKGAMFPWQSGSSGREETQVVHLNPKSGRWLPDKSRLQRHVNIAIAYNVWQYYQATGDTEFMLFYGAEMLLEISRFWASICTFDEELGRYEIHGIMGPDEYHEEYPGAEEPGLSNNAYTNLMVVWLMLRALDSLDMLPDYRRAELTEAIGFTEAEAEHWRDIACKMRVVFQADGIISQFEGYEKLKEFDWAGYRKKYGNIMRLDRILEAEGDSADHYKLSKQADLLMLFYLLTSEELADLFKRLGYDFEYETIPTNIDYYLERTSHGSTLSGVVNSWVLARSDRPRSWQWFKQALYSDVTDVQGGTTKEGVHLGAMAGTVDLVQRCYAGASVREGVLHLQPQLPDELKRVRLRLRHRGHWLSLEIDGAKLKAKCESGGAGELLVKVGETLYTFCPGDAREFDL